MHKKAHKNKNGFTLIELLMYMALFSIFMMSLTEMFVSLLESKTQSEALSSVEQDGRFILARLSYDINRATSISTPATPGASGNSLVMTVGGSQFTYALSSDNLQLMNSLGTNNLNGSGTKVTSINFQRLGTSGKDSIKIDFTIASVAVGNNGAEARTFSTTVTKR